MVVVQELRAANETLRTLQKQLELVPSPSSSTVRVLLDTKDARIATLEREVTLLEREVERLGIGHQMMMMLEYPLATPAPASSLPQLHQLPHHQLLPAATSTTDLHLLPTATGTLGTAAFTAASTSTVPLKRQVSFLLNDVQIGKDGTVIGRL